MADSYEINLEIQGGEQPALVMETEGGATDGASARNAEAWAAGTRNGVPVEEGDPAYHNNSKYYRDSAAAIVAGDIIDDDAGRGDTMLAWSADKLVGEFGKKAPAIVVSDTTAEPVKTFSDGADGMPMGLTVGVEPVQDLHGYDNPWPAGGGKNKFDFKTVYADTSKFTINGESVTGTASNFYYAQVHIPASMIGQQCTFSAKISTGADTTNMKVRVQFADTTVINGNAISSGNTGVSSVTFTPTSTDDFVCIAYGSGGTGVNVASEFQIESGSTATEWTPYSNICPISGWTGAEVTRTGKNLLDFTVKNNAGITATKVDGKAKLSGTATAYAYPVDGISVNLKPGTYVWSVDGLTTGAGLTYTKNGAWAGTVTNGLTITLTKEATIGAYISVVTGTTLDTTVSFMLESGSSASAFEPYQGETYEITFPSSAGTVYGGTLTVNADGTGTLVVDRAIVDLGTLDWSLNNHATLGDYFYASISSLGVKYEGVFSTTVYNAICTNYVCTRRYAGAFKNGAFTFDGSSVLVTQLQVKDSAYSDGSAFKTAMSGVQLVYELATPQVYTLTDLDLVETLKGMNNLWADTGDIKSVDYPADTKLYIDGKIAEIQALILENISNS